MKNLYNNALITKQEYDLINKEMVIKYKPLYEDEIDTIL